MRIRDVHPGIEATNVGVLRVRTFRWILHELVTPRGGYRLVDLGAGPCKFARDAVDSGFEVTAVDARDERLPEHLGSIQFVKADVRDFDVSGYDVVAIIGLLYHLPLADQLALLRRVDRGATVVIDTQIHVPELSAAPSAHDRGAFAQKIVSSGDYEGVLFPEADNPMAAVGNHESWWHTEPSLLQMLENVGVGEVTKIEPLYLSKYGARKWYIASVRSA